MVGRGDGVLLNRTMRCNSPPNQNSSAKQPAKRPPVPQGCKPGHRRFNGSDDIARLF